MKAWVYLTTNRPDCIINTSVISELKYRIGSHKTEKYPDAFTARYNLDKLVNFEEYNSIVDARASEKQIKAGSRLKKVKG